MLSYHNQKIKQTGKIIGKRAACFDLPAGHTCPMADICHSKVVIRSGHRTIVDSGIFRCYATKAEVQYKTVYNARRHNYRYTLSDNFARNITKELIDSRIELLRIHSSGDFYNYSYFRKWIKIAQTNPKVIFYGYTKQATFCKIAQELNLDNFHLIYSTGGKLDQYAIANKLPACHVIINGYNPLNLPIACKSSPADDLGFILRGESFGINVH